MREKDPRQPRSRCWPDAASDNFHQNRMLNRSKRAKTKMQKSGYIEQEGFRGETSVVIFRRSVPHQEAEFAMELIGRFGSIAAEPDGYDPEGRQKLKLQSPEDLVKRACEIAELAFAEFARRDWILDLPDPKPAKSKTEL